MKRVTLILAGAVLLLLAADTSFSEREDVNARDPNGQTALMRAALAGDADTVKALIEAGAKVEMRDRYSETALHMAVSSGHAEVVKLLLGTGAKKEARDGSLLIAAAASGHADVVKLLLDAGANKEKARWYPYSFTSIWRPGPKDKRPPLLPGEAYYGTSLSGFSIMLTATQPEFGGDIYEDLWGDVGQTALTVAASKGHLEVVKLLLNAGASTSAHTTAYSGRITKRGSSGGIPLLWSVTVDALGAAKYQNHQDVVDLLTAAGDGGRPPAAPSTGAPSDPVENANPPSVYALYAALIGGNAGRILDATGGDDLATVRALLKENPGLVLSKDPYGATLLHKAAFHGHRDVAELLLANKADVNGKDSDAWTPLHYAAEWGHKDMAELLLANGADVQAKIGLANYVRHSVDLTGATPLHAAAAYGHKDVAALLLASKADVNAKESDGGTPLHRAAGRGQPDVAEILLAKGADVNAKDSGGKTPLKVVTSVSLSGLIPVLPVGASGMEKVAELLWLHGGHE